MKCIKYVSNSNTIDLESTLQEINFLAIKKAFIFLVEIINISMHYTL